MGNTRVRLVNEKEISHSLKMKKITEQMSRIMPSDGKAQSPLPVTPLAESMCVSALQLFHSSVGDRAYVMHLDFSPIAHLSGYELQMEGEVGWNDSERLHHHR